MRARRALSALSPVIFFIGCDVMARAFDDGYAFGYGCTDALYGCYEADRERREEIAEATQVWEDNCDDPVEPLFSTSQELEAADQHCADSNGYGSVLVVCSNGGQEVGAEPPGCSPYERPVAVVIAGDYSCPNPIGDEKLCICCDEASAGRSGCGLPGRWCFDDADCCAGSCTKELVEDGDGGLVEETRGTCD